MDVLEGSAVSRGDGHGLTAPQRDVKCVCVYGHVYCCGCTPRVCRGCKVACACREQRVFDWHKDNRPAIVCVWVEGQRVPDGPHAHLPLLIRPPSTRWNVTVGAERVGGREGEGERERERTKQSVEFSDILHYITPRFIS